MKITCTRGTAGQMLEAFKDKLVDLGGVAESTDIEEGERCRECIEDCDAVDTNQPVMSATTDEYTEQIETILFKDGANIIDEVNVQFNSGGLTVSVDTVHDDHFDLDITDDELSGDPYEDADVILDAIYEYI